MTAELTNFKIKLMPNPADCSVEMNGVDISKAVASCSAGKMSQGDIPTVVLELWAGSVELETTAMLVVPKADVINEVFDSLNPSEIEDEALRALPFGGSTTGEVIRIIKERIDAAQS